MTNQQLLNFYVECRKRVAAALEKAKRSGEEEEIRMNQRFLRVYDDNIEKTKREIDRAVARGGN